MPTRTPHFGLQAFVAGDYYSATVDKERFTIIDQHMAFLSDIIGPGRITGWVITQPNPGILSINVTEGMGMIDRNITRTFGDYDRSILDNNFIYVWMKRRPGVIGQSGAFSNLAIYDHIDLTPPITPTGFSAGQTTISSIIIEWDANTVNYDFKEFNIYKSLDNIEFEFVTSTTDTNYLDSNLDDNTTYYYQVSSVDFTGNESNRTAVLSVTTDLDPTPPSDPVNVSATPATNAVHLLWRPGTFGDIVSYRIYYTPVNLENESIGDTNLLEVDAEFVYASINDLMNVQKYEFRLVSVGDNGVESAGVILYETPDQFNGPRDVVDLIISDQKGNDFVSDVVLVVEWEPYSDPYDPNPPVSHEIQIQEIDNENSDIITSIWINESTEIRREFSVYAFDDDGINRNRSIRERTTYFVTVRAIDADGNSSIGRVGRHYTRSYETPRPPSTLTAEQRDDLTIEFSWFNSTSIFSNNVINLSRIDNTDPSNSEIIEEDLELGRARSYIIPQENILPDSIYEFRIKAVDEFGNESSERTSSFDIPNLDDLPPPNVPSQVLGVANDSQITLSWNQPTNTIPASFRIYKSTEQVVYEASDFTRVETVDSQTFSYTDYDVNNDLTYAYFVTTVDLYGRESLNPIEDDFFDYNLVLLTPTVSGELGTPANLTAAIDGLNSGIDLIWDPTAGIQFDGYEVFRSINNTYSFELIGTTGAAETAFNDPQSLTEAGTFYYIVRKFRNEADLFITESDIAVTGALFLGTVETVNGDVTIDQSAIREIKDLEDPVRERAQELIEEHKHEFVTSIDDRRINLGDSIRVEDWLTSDFQNYTTITDLSDTFAFEVYLNGTLASDFQLLFNLDKESGRLTFEQRLAPTDFIRDEDQDFPFEVGPEVVVVFQGLTETQETLPQERIESASATQVTIGLVEERQLPTLNHDGRIDERLIPVQIDTIAVDDGYRYAPILEDARIGDAITWYDVILAEGQDGDVLIGSNSDGIYTSEDFGVTWTRQLTLVTPVIEFFYSASINLYIALTNRGVFGSRGGTSGGFSVWREIRGMENSKVTRGLSETPEGDIFCTSDLGVFKLVQDVGRNFYFWEQTPIFGPRSTESYDTIYDPIRDRVIVSNELGIFETKNAGGRWDFSDEMPDQRPIFQFLVYGDSIFAITQFIVWRRKIGEELFQRVTVFQDVDFIRKIAIWRDRLFITTDKGLLVTLPGTDLIEDNTFEFELAFPQMNISNYTPPATSMNIIDDKMFVGTEEQLFLAPNPGSMSLHWEERADVVPTIYVDGVEQRIGVRYTTATRDLRKFVCFDEKQPVDAVVTIANQYERYQAERGGWADTDFSAGIRVYVNGLAINDRSIVERPAQAISNLTVPTYTDRNAHKAGADLALLDVSTIATNLVNLGDDEDNPVLINFNKDNVNIFLNQLDRFLSQLYPEARLVDDENGNSVPFEIPAFRVLLLSADSSQTSVGLESFGTYTTNSSLELDLGGAVAEEDVGGGIGGVP